MYSLRSLPSLFWALFALSFLTTTIMTNTPEPKPEPKPEVVDLHRLIRCLEEIEGGQWNWPGGKLRISRAFWHDHGKSSYIHACDPTKARETVARAFAKYLHDCEQFKIEPTVKYLARCYNLGWNGAVHDPKAKSDYADRVANLYYDPSFKGEL